jgi:hypothetical protein
MNEELNGGPVADTAEEMSVADSIRAAFDEVEGSSTTTDADPAASPRDDGRDQRGRFAPKQAAETTAPDPAAEPVAPEAQPAAPETETPAVPAVEAPQHWAAADKERFAKLPPDGQQFLLDRHKAMEGDYTRRMQEIAPLRKTAEQWTPYLAQIGATPEQAFQALIGAEYTLRNGTPDQKQAALRQLAQDYQIPLTQAAPQPATDEYVDPQVAALNQKLAQLEAWKNSSEQAEQQRQRQQMEQRQSELHSTIAAFTAEKTEAGAPAHPHYEAVRETMAALIGGGQASDLKTAYDMAVWARPDLRQQLLTAQQEAAAKKSAEEAKARAQKAGTAAASVSGKPVGATPMGPANSVREELERAWASARV